MKKLFTLIALLTCFIGAKAVEVVDKELIFADVTDLKTEVWSIVEGATLDLEEGCLHYHSDAAGANAWDTQFKLSDLNGIEIQLGSTYTIELKIKGSVENGSWWNIAFAGKDKYGAFTFGTDWEVKTLVYENVESTNNNSPLLQCGSYVGDLWIEYIKISHEQKEGQKELQWKDNMLVNGDAEAEWPAWSLEETDGVNINWRTDRAKEICAWSLTMGRNFDEVYPWGDDSGRARPFPADIIVDEGNPDNHVFNVHIEEIQDIEGGGDGSIAWSNQFFITAPKGFKAGTQVKISFKYKASVACTVPTQVHHEYPSYYLHYTGALGDISFTDEWQTFDKVVTLDGWSGGDLGWTIAFNLNNDADNARTAPLDFYFDEITWQEMDLEEGFFAAAIATGEDYDTDNAIAFADGDDVDIDGNPILVATVGASTAWVDEVMISTVRGYDNAFKKNTIQLADGALVNAKTVETWMSFEDAANAKIKLTSGVWEIQIDRAESMIYFSQIEGDPLVDPVDIITNASELVIEAVERHYKNAEEAEQYGATDLPEDYEYNGQPWDNQFFIESNREFVADEETVIEFDYYLISEEVTEAKVSSQGQGAPGAYKGGGAGDLTFTPEEQHWIGNFKIPASSWSGPITGVKSIAFNMAEIPQACTYVIKNVKWYLKYPEEGKTGENLINAEGTDNFWAKISAGTDPYNWTTGPVKKADPNINGDETINGQDLQALINAIVAESTDTAKFDITGDGQINGQDLQALINIIVAQE